MIKMTDEEMAEEYSEKNVCGHCKQCNGAYIGCDKYRYTKQSFLAGLKIGRQNDQFSKAKEIIEKVAEMYRYSPRAEEIIQQAEQFLKEIE